jgi:hypothetical protein
MHDTCPFQPPDADVSLKNCNWKVCLFLFIRICQIRQIKDFSNALVMILFSPVNGYWHFRWTCCLHPQSSCRDSSFIPNVGNHLPDFLLLKCGRSSEVKGYMYFSWMLVTLHQTTVS